MPRDDDTDTHTPRPLPALRRNRGDLTLEDRLDSIEETQQLILEKLSTGNATFASMLIRLRALEYIVYGAVMMALVGVAGSLLYLVLHGGPAGHP